MKMETITALKYKITMLIKHKNMLTHFDVALCSQVVDFSRSDLGDDFHQTRAVGHVAIVQLKLG